MSHIVQYLGLIYVKCVSEPSDGQFYAADNPDDKVLRSRPRLKGAGYRVRSTSRSASPMLGKGILKRDLTGEFEKIHLKEKFSDLKTTKINFHTEKHETPWAFKTIIDKTKHLILSHSCPLVKCSFYCEFDAEMIQHMDCVH